MKNKNYIIIIIFILISLLIYFNYIVNPPFKIDIVYTWAGENKTSDIRLAYNNELKYSLRSIMMFAPWVNKIYIYMNNPKKVPSWFNDKYKEKIIIIDHTETELEHFLPNTNSNAIESTISSIPDLSEHFIYFNDDCFLGRPVKWTEFFTLLGKPYIANFKKESMHIDPYDKKIDIDIPDFSVSYSKSGGWLHIPLPRLKSESLLFEKTYNDYIDWIRNTKKRNKEGCDICTEYNLKCPCHQLHSLLGVFMYERGKAVIKDYKYEDTYIENKNYNYVIKKLRNFKNNPTTYLCINDSNNNTFMKETINKVIFNFYEIFFYKKPFFEK